ncbi:MAG: DUF1800 domain-containing protein [Planctomycetota bacterium]|nr:DUF1800 domain-containing protein [Planctomycetota bacterium]
MTAVAPPRLPLGGIDRLLARISYGYDPWLRDRAHSLGWTAFLEEQLHPESFPDPRGDAVVARFPTLSMTPRQIWDAYGVNGQHQVPMVELQTATLLRAALSRRQLHERMVEFWGDHFSIDQSDSQASILKTQDDHDVCRAQSLSSFPLILRASARSAAMLFSLGNYRSMASSPNENYGREILELHSLGVGNYTEHDVREAARCLTGWGFLQFGDPNAGTFRFEPSLHDNGPKDLLGLAIPAGGGILDGYKLVRLAALHPATAQRMSRKLCRWFLGAEPQPVVDAASAEWAATEGDLRSVLRIVLAPSSFASVPEGVQKTKRPFHLAAGILRALPFQFPNPTQLAGELAAMGHRPFHWPAPDGYPDAASAWVGGLQGRWSFASRLFANQVSGVRIDVAAVFGTAPKSSWARRAAYALRGPGPLTTDVDAVQQYVDGFASASDALRAETLALTASAPSFQVY